ncbi:MAG TPA: sulfatase [Verrucomicrobiales bacterium]|nr:sulfatase [Verrucomicrobiales bacterium]
MLSPIRQPIQQVLVVCAVLLIAAPLDGSASLERPNVLFIAIDDLRNDLGALGALHARTPQLDGFATTARLFSHHYAQAPTCGASRCALLRGRYPALPAHVGNNAIRDTQSEWAAQSLPAVFRQHGYQTLALGKISHYPGGLTGRDWAEGPEELPGGWDRAWIPGAPWPSPQGIMHGYANGMARAPGESPPWQAFDGPDEAYPDAWVAAEAVATLEHLAAQKQPWFFGVGFFKPHLPFAAPKKWHDLHEAGVPDLTPEAAAKPAWPSGWHGSDEFRGNYGHTGRDPDTDADYARLLRRAYAASVSYVDAQIGRVLRAVSEAGLEENTVVVVWSDHGLLLGEHAIWGKHCLYEPALRSPLIIRHPGMNAPGQTSAALVETVDLFPTLADLCGLAVPEALVGNSLRPQLNDPAAPTAKPAYSFWTHGRRSVRTERWRLIADSSGENIELFDYQSDPGETRNHAAARPAIVGELLVHLERAPEPEPATSDPGNRKAE